MLERCDYGSWPSTITAADVAAGSRPLGSAAFLGSSVLIEQARPEQGGRITLWKVDAATGARQGEVIAEQYNVRSRVHEYGGATWLALEGAPARVVFVNFADQRLYVVDVDSGRVDALSPETRRDGDPLWRFAEPVPGPAGHILAILEDNSAEPVRHIVAVPLDGSAAEDRQAITRLTPPARFVAAPRISPDGRRLAWISWEHPNMPWDGTELHVAQFSDAGLSSIRTIAGDAQTSVLQPEWLDGNRLVYLGDASGWWNPYLHELDAGATRRLVDEPAEFAGPLWQVGTTWYVVESGDSLLMSHGTGLTALGRVGVAAGRLDRLELDYTRIRPLQLRDGRLLAATSSMRDGEQITLIDLAGLETRSLARAIETLPPAGLLPRVEQFECRNAHGQPVHALLYRPRNEHCTGPAGQPAPFVTLVHGGPTAQAAATLSTAIAYYTSRGIGVVDVNYGGSSGYGREYRNRLRGQWGVVDVQDTVAVIDALVARGIADPARIAIEGGSAGGWTVLCALVFTDRFKAGISRYGVADLAGLVTSTHDFESRYMFSLVGPYPQEAGLYAQRAPLNHLQRLDCPVLVLQGDQDKVVPPSQSEAVVRELSRRGIPHAYILFKGEQHGFRIRRNIIRALEASLGFYAQVFGFTADVPGLELS